MRSPDSATTRLDDYEDETQRKESTFMTAVVSPQLLQALTDITGEIHLDSALRIVTQDAIAHRLESIALVD